MFWETLRALVLDFSLSRAVQAFVSRREMRRLLGDSGGLSLLRATGFGAASSSCSYASAAMAKSLFSEGASFVTAMVFMFASTNLVIELGIVLAVLTGWQFTASELLGGLLLLVLFVITARATLPTSLSEEARHRLRTAAEVSGASPAAPPPDSRWRARLRSGALWRAAAGSAFADPPDAAQGDRWRLPGGGFPRRTGVGRGLAGPVLDRPRLGLVGRERPHRSAHRHAQFRLLGRQRSTRRRSLEGGMSFGGVASFLSADLITLPLLLIYRKYYGGRLTLRLLATFWLVMSSAGLATWIPVPSVGGDSDHPPPSDRHSRPGLEPHHRA